MAEEIKKGDYSRLGLVKIEDVVLYHGRGIDQLPDNTITWLANYGLFVAMTRALATKADAPYDDFEKDVIFQHYWKWLADGMPKSKRKHSPSVAISTIEAKAKEMGLTPEQIATLLGKAEA